MRYARLAADEILVVAHPDDQAGWLEEGTGATAQARFGLPITRVTVPKTDRSRDLAASDGRDTRTHAPAGKTWFV